MKKKINLGISNQNLDINFDDISLVPQLIGVNNKNLREIEDIIDVEIDSQCNKFSQPIWADPKLHLI